MSAPIKNLESKDLIRYYVSKRINSYYKLTLTEKCELVAAHIRGLPAYDKNGILCDSDRQSILPDLLANLIEQRASSESIQKLVDAILHIYVIGTNDSDPTFYRDFDEMFDDEWQERWPSQNEHFENDARIRTLDAQWGAKC